MRVEELTREEDDGVDVVEIGKPRLSLFIHHNIRLKLLDRENRRTIVRDPPTSYMIHSFPISPKPPA